MKPSALMRPLVLAALVVLDGCASAPARHLLSLPLPSPSPSTSPAASSPQATSQLTTTPALIVRRVGIPEYLQSDQVRFRQADSLLGEWPHTAWAERLEVGLTDHLVMRLRLALPGWTVCERACPAQAKPTVLTVDFAPLDYVRAAGQLRADAHWQLIGMGGHGSTVVTASVQPDSAEGQAAALGQVLDRLASDIAAALHTGP